jgi:Zn-dependent protease with chaperone function
MTMENTTTPPAQDLEKPWKISGRIPPARLGPLYQLGTALTALAMVLLPLLYLGLIGGVGWAVYRHASNDAGDIDNSGNLFLYIAPIVIGVILILFMVKPLFARRTKPIPTVEITRQQEPKLFAFIDQICTLVRAPRPRRVVVDLNVNASASFTRGFIGLASNNLTLTIGLPLVTGLSVRELGGVFAHEFGHFAQGAGMRLTYLIRSLNAWFARLVYERDSWDVFLREAGSKIDIRIGIIFHIARLMVWLTRKILWVFMWAGHGISCFMLRQMEFDADHYETQVAGSDAFIRTCKALPVIGVGWQRAVSRQQESFAAKRLVDDLATYTALETQRVSPETKDQIVKSVKGAKTGWFDTHPTDFDRMRVAHHAKAKGVLSGEDSSTTLFGEFSALARQVTAAYYVNECEIDLGKVQLLPLDLVAGEAEAIEEADKAMRDYFKELLTLRTLIIVSPGELRRTPPFEQLQEEARAAVLRHGRLIAGVAAPVEALLAADGADAQAVQAQTLLAAGFTIKSGGFGLKKGNLAEADAAAAQARLQIAQHRDTLAEPLSATRERLVSALRFYFLEPRPEALDAAAAEEVERLARIIGRFEEMTDAIVNLRNQLGALDVLLQNQPEEISQEFLNTLRRAGRHAEDDARHITAAMERLEYPFDHAGGKVLLADFLGECTAHADGSVQAYLRGQVVFDRLMTLYRRAMGRLAHFGLRAERALLPVAGESPPEG